MEIAIIVTLFFVGALIGGATYYLASIEYGTIGFLLTTALAVLVLHCTGNHLMNETIACLLGWAVGFFGAGAFDLIVKKSEEYLMSH